MMGHGLVVKDLSTGATIIRGITAGGKNVGETVLIDGVSSVKTITLERRKRRRSPSNDVR